MRTLVKYPLEIAVSAILVALVTVTFSQVVFRYLLHAPLAWSEELARFLLMWMASLSAAYAFKTRSHFAYSHHHHPQYPASQICPFLFSYL